MADLLDRSTSASSVCRAVAATAGGFLELGMEGTIRCERGFGRQSVDDRSGVNRCRSGIYTRPDKPQDENQYEDLQIPLGSIVLGASDAVSLYIDLTTSGKKSEEFGNTFDQAACHS